MWCNIPQHHGPHKASRVIQRDHLSVGYLLGTLHFFPTTLAALLIKEKCTEHVTRMRNQITMADTLAFHVTAVALRRLNLRVTAELQKSLHYIVRPSFKRQQQQKNFEIRNGTKRKSQSLWFLFFYVNVHFIIYMSLCRIHVIVSISVWLWSILQPNVKRYLP